MNIAHIIIYIGTHYTKHFNTSSVSLKWPPRCPKHYTDFVEKISESKTSTVTFSTNRCRSSIRQKSPGVKNGRSIKGVTPETPSNYLPHFSSVYALKLFRARHCWLRSLPGPSRDSVT